MTMKIDYEDIPKDKIEYMRKQVFRQNRVIRLWSALSCASAILISSLIAMGVFPQSQDHIGRLILSILLAVLLAVLLWKAIVDPQIRRSVERSMKQSENGIKTEQCVAGYDPQAAALHTPSHGAHL